MWLNIEQLSLTTAFVISPTRDRFYLILAFSQSIASAAANFDLLGIISVNVTH